MQIRAPIAVQAILKSLTEVIVPAVDPQNKMAQEQVGLVIGLLTLLAERLPMTFAYDLEELDSLTRLAGDLASLVEEDELADAARMGRDVVDRAKASPEELIETIALLRTTLGNFALGLPLRDDAGGRAAIRALLGDAQARQLRERSWLLMQGWESDPKSIPAIETLIGTAV